tara:strand:+ start:151 stop:450 length:300 start_codon:yes stop_codon:yes gene_type:complete
MEDNKENVEPETKPKFNVKEYMRDYHKNLYNSNPDAAKQKRNFYKTKNKYDIKDFDKWYGKYKFDLYNIIKLVEMKNLMKPGHFEMMLMDLKDFEFVKK